MSPAPRVEPLVTANEVRIPVGRTVAFELTGNDVIHSFWIPGLAGKMDMIPGRTNRLVVRAARAGTFRRRMHRVLRFKPRADGFRRHRDGGHCFRQMACVRSQSVAASQRPGRAALR